MTRDSRFRADVEGLRGLAVVLVLLFHAGVPGIGGGYVGVDVFFVISGFLITGMLLRELSTTGTIALGSFLAARARRILPAASAVLVATAVAAWLLLPPLRVRETMIDVVAAALQVANLRFISQETDYMTADAAPSPVLHYWSLAVEEQFYLVFPLLLLGAAFVARRAGWSPVAVAGTVVVGVSVASFLYSLVLTTADPGSAYMSPLTRAWQLGAGGIAALALHGRRGSGVPRVRSVLVWVGVAAVVVAAVVLDEETPFPGTAALLPTLGTVAILAAGAGGLVGAGILLAAPPVRWVGRLSFSWYLTHWPVVVLAEAVLGDLRWPTLVVLTLVAGVLAYGLMETVENRVRRSRVVLLRPAHSYAVGVSGVLVALGAGLGLGSDVYEDLAQASGTLEGTSLSDVLTPEAAALTGGPTTPGPGEAAADAPPLEYPCLSPMSELDLTWHEECTTGPDDGLDVVLFGDSKAFQWSGAMRTIAEDHGWRLTIVTKGGCSAADIPQRFTAESVDCERWRAAQLPRIGEEADVVVVSTSTSYFFKPQAEILRDDAWDRTLDAFRSADIPVVYVRDVPVPDFDVPGCISEHVEDWSRCEFSRSASLAPDPLLLRAVLGDEPGVEGVDMSASLCPSETCQAVLGGVLMYRDASHLTWTTTGLLTGELESKLLATQAFGTPRS
ncbi:acyltransferase family protein [Paraoerskovia marina]|uniref:acyltransferase family protein n=1 Tax=Paraoerskovia marina TaxID=545619 RepID=UPI000694CEB2|nr:acyltransferase family protein [Paraoerskovia marina]